MFLEISFKDGNHVINVDQIAGIVKYGPGYIIHMSNKDASVQISNSDFEELKGLLKPTSFPASASSKLSDKMDER